MREIKAARSNLHFQTGIAALEVKGLRPNATRQEGAAQRSMYWLHGGRLGARRQLTGSGEMLVFRVGIHRGTRRGKSSALLLVTLHFLEKLLERHMRGRGLRLARSKDGRRRKDAVAQHLRKEQEQKDAKEKNTLPERRGARGSALA